MSQQFKVNGLEIKRGNRKMPDDTLIFNMGPASCCPSRALGMCKVPEGHCYALCDERFFGNTVVDYRLRQMKYWLLNTQQKILCDFQQLFENHKKAMRFVDFFRFNESGDFWGQECVNKLSFVAFWLKEHYDVVTYGFTAREDLNFDKVHFLVKGSGCDNGNNGKAIVVSSIAELDEINSDPFGPHYKLCPSECDRCNACRETLEPSHPKYNVAFNLHR